MTAPLGSVTVPRTRPYSSSANAGVTLNKVATRAISPAISAKTLKPFTPCFIFLFLLENVEVERSSLLWNPILSTECDFTAQGAHGSRDLLRSVDNAGTSFQCKQWSK